MSILIKTTSTDVSTLLARLTAARAGYLDELAAANIPTDLSTITGRLTATRAGYLDAISRDRPNMIFPSATPLAIIAVPASASADIPFPDVAVSGLPSGITIARVDIALVIGSLFDTSSSENQIAAADKTLRVKASAAGWAAGIPALTFVQNSLQVDTDAYRGGTVLFGGTDIKSIVTADGTYNFQSDHDTHNDCVIATGASLELLDVSVVIRVWYN